MSYFVIHGSEDGIVVNEYTNKANLLNVINPNSEFDNMNEYGRDNFLAKIPDDFNCTGDNDILIIRGEVIVPTPIKVVQQLEID